MMFFAGVVLLYAVAHLLAVRRYGPKDTTGNGITIGRAKAFDNRSLQLRIERLSAGLAQLKIVNQNITENLPAFQQQTSSESTRSLTLEVKASPGKAESDGSSKSKAGEKEAKSDSTTAGASKTEAKPAVGMAAGDILSDQLNLASQIMNLEMIYERSLTDRLIDGGARLQTVLGFQVSIAPAAGYENCVAVVEVAVRMKGNETPVSLVALIPQEKTYNAQSVSTSAQSIGGSAVASVFTLGYTSKGESRQLFIHRDSDTIAFERDPRTNPKLFKDSQATVFGWEFRPVLGRSTVSAGTRQMLAVIALPAPDKENEGEVTLEIKTRSYWRRYNQKKQTSRIKWGLLPWRIDGSNKIDYEQPPLSIPNTAKIQEALAPRVTKINWVNSGSDRATVVVEGSNFFSGTKVVAGGIVYSEENKNLTLKSTEALEFEPTLASLAMGDPVLSGRFGSSFQLASKGTRPVSSMYIGRASIRPSGLTGAFRLSIVVVGTDADGHHKDLTVQDLATLPEPILFIGSEPAPLPYFYFDKNPDTGTGTGDGVGMWIPKKAVRVEAWIGAKALEKGQSVGFRVPFCGSDYQASEPLSFADPKPAITRMGSNEQNTVFRIAHPSGFGGGFTVELDRVYEEAPGVLERITQTEIRFQAPTNIVSQYRNMVLRVGKDAYVQSYVLPVPAVEKPKARPMIDESARPPQIAKDTLGPVEWSGTDLEGITGATLYASPQAESGAQPSDDALRLGVKADFAVFDAGKKIEVHFSEGSTGVIGKAQVEFQTATLPFRVPIFITKPTR